MIKKFLEYVEESDSDEVLEILQYIGETEPITWVNDFTRFSNGLIVVYFKDYNQIPNETEINGCNHRLNQIGYSLISYDKDKSNKLWFLVMSQELESKYRNELSFKFIEDLDLEKIGNDWKNLTNFSISHIDYPGGDTISIITDDQGWFISDSITDNEETSANKVVANICLLKAQHRVSGIIKSLKTRGF
jgi:hypothetical protein